MINKLLELYLCQLLVVSLDQSSKFGNNPGAILIFQKKFIIRLPIWRFLH